MNIKCILLTIALSSVGIYAEASKDNPGDGPCTAIRAKYKKAKKFRAANLNLAQDEKELLAKRCFTSCYKDCCKLNRDFAQREELKKLLEKWNDIGLACQENKKKWAEFKCKFKKFTIKRGLWMKMVYDSGLKKCYDDQGIAKYKEFKDSDNKFKDALTKLPSPLP